MLIVYQINQLGIKWRDTLWGASGSEMSFPLDGHAAVGMEQLEFIAVALPGKVLDLDAAGEEKPRYAALLP